MLDAYIIDSIRRDDEERERAFERRRIHAELPIERDHPRQPARRGRREPRDVYAGDVDDDTGRVLQAEQREFRPSARKAR